MSWFNSLLRGAARRPNRRLSAIQRRPRLETLEDRLQPAFTGLGMAGDFAVLGLTKTHISNINATVSGNAGISHGGKLDNWAPSSVTVDVFQSVDGQYSGNGHLGGELLIDPDFVMRANSDALTAANEAAALPATQTFGTIGQSMTVIGNGGLNVIQINGDLRESLTLSGTAADVFIVNITGKLMITGNSVLGLDGGVTADHVLYNVIGSGGTVATGTGNVVYGTLLAPQRIVHADGTYFGEIIGGGGSIKLSNSRIIAIEFDLTSAARIVSTEINSGAAQRSRVTDLTVTFDQSVTFSTTAAAAFTLVRTSDNAAVNFTATVSTVAGQTVVFLTDFTGSAAEFGSLADGRYTLTALTDQISANGQALDGDGDGQSGGNYTFGDAEGLFRYFGDMNGDARLDIADFGLFSQTFNRAFGDQAFNPALDFNNDGRIDIADFGQFSVRYFTTLP